MQVREGVNPSTALSEKEVEPLVEALAAPFEVREVKFKPGRVSGNRALALAYVDARVIQDRLDEVVGVLGWQDEYECLPDGSVVCRLRLRLGDQWITKMDVGGPSEQSDEGDRRKAAFSDALKRAAVKFGVGRYLYRLPALWADFDPSKKQFVKKPALPPFAQPKPIVAARVGGTEAPPKKEPAAPPPKPATALPTNGAELQQRLYAYDAHLAKQSLCRTGELVQYVVAVGKKAGHDADLSTWSGPAITLAVEATRAFETRLRQANKEKERKEVA
jgi:hypothetical protein